MPKTSNVPGTDRPADKAAGHWARNYKLAAQPRAWRADRRG